LLVLKSSQVRTKPDNKVTPTIHHSLYHSIISIFLPKSKIVDHYSEIIGLIITLKLIILVIPKFNHSKLPMKYKSFSIFLVFLAMGFADAVGPLVGLAKETFDLSNAAAQLLPMTGLLMFGLLSIPMGIVQDKRGKLFVLVAGLILAVLGAGLPWIGGLNHYVVLVVAVALLGAGATLLQVSGNPIMRDVSPEGKYSRNLSLGQFIKAIGTLSTAGIPLLAKNYFNADWSVIFPIYSIAILVTILIVSTSGIKEDKNKQATAATFRSCFALLKNRYVLMMVFGIFMYVGAEICVSSGMALYLEEQFGLNIQETGLAGTGLFFLAIMTGRFLGGIILNWVKAKHFLLVSVFVSLIGIAGLFLGIKSVGFISSFIIGIGFANIFPLIFSITVDKMPDRANELSGLMVTAILGGAVLPPLMGVLADNTSVLTGMLVPLVAIFYIGWISLKVQRA
jgi:FHS family L-fucose permease-like MFS transporter